MGRLGSSGSTPVDFTDGDTYKRVSVADTSIEATAQLHLGIDRQQIADVDDAGWVFVPNTIRVYAGGFDCVIAAIVLGEPGINDEGPNEQITLTYLID